MITVKEVKRSLLVSLWFVFLTFPLMVIKVNPYERTVSWRWSNMVYVAIGTFVISLLAKAWFVRKERRMARQQDSCHARIPIIQRILQRPGYRYPLAAFLLGAVLAFPHLFSTYQANIMTTALMYIVLGLGLNIVVGVAGLLDLGYVAFYAVGAYSYALLNLHFGLGFWTVLPVGGLLAALFGVLLGFPVLRLRGDYLAIVTLGFGEIIRLILENWNAFSKGPSGISNIPRPGFFGLEMSLDQAMIYMYYLMIGLLLVTIFVVNRLQDSRLGRAWLALREDEIACQAMGIDKTRTKLIAFSLGAFWAGLIGVIFAAKTTFVNPASFTFMESAIILSIVVLGGMGSIVGVILGALILVLLPEYLRALSEYRMLAFGAILVAMMIFKPEGLIANVRRIYCYQGRKSNTALKNDE
ncbi:MAG: branched-chain amino acid ABC transporter permease [Proteobacteria bacterium]|jgi:branched-chain amino acid transport system permease protein|nr:branched-chain amino acid ABC transporter permease [Desulfocapsa sp.]MBU3946054.1 branched-chain amino acid ABC transporter permease [Pseudomonadota bacterium]MCG2743371.1 branched-chain amino acid ABC transporter permease [Desulfobacteraceae bacterium]MBU3983433.1 branched-chain amino acid ABC transporter permease [Pseudomonadota bacterium]MBU4028745.1 branched-chain amino acid ABC transporter permease [Pseudomonadota bacterium]